MYARLQGRVVVHEETHEEEWRGEGYEQCKGSNNWLVVVCEAL